MRRNGPGRRALSEAEAARLVAEAMAAPRGGRLALARRYGVSPSTVTRLVQRAGYGEPAAPELRDLIARIRYVALRGGRLSFKQKSCAVLLAALEPEDKP